MTTPRTFFFSDFGVDTCFSLEITSIISCIFVGCECREKHTSSASPWLRKTGGTSFFAQFPTRCWKVLAFGALLRPCSAVLGWSGIVQECWVARVATKQGMARQGLSPEDVFRCTRCSSQAGYNDMNLYVVYWSRSFEKIRRGCG